MSTKKRTFLENTWYAAAWDYEVAEADNKLARRICNVPLVFFKGEDGQYIALDDRCCHRAAPLSIGRVEGSCIRCMYHGILYDSEGTAIEIPGEKKIPKSMKVRSYPVVLQGRMLWIWMGDPKLADPDEIYKLPAMSQNDKWRGFERPSYLHYNANWLLIVDNLADFSHVAFVHTNTLGGSEAYAYSTVAENIKKDKDGFSMVRWHRSSPPPPFHKKNIPESEHDVLLDRANFTQMRIPGVFLMDTIFAPEGWDEEKNDRSVCREYRNCQFMTPETDNTTHFFWNYFHGFDLDNSTLSVNLEASLLEGFMEDKVFIEAQQKLLETSPEFRPKFFSADEAFSHFRLRWKEALKKEDNERPLEDKPNPMRIL